MSDYTTPEGTYNDLVAQFGHSSIADVPVNGSGSGSGNDDDRGRVTRPAPHPTTKPRFPEKLMVETRRSVAMNLYESVDERCFVDDVYALTLELAKKAVQRAIFVVMETHEETTSTIQTYTGQAGIVNNWIVTAMHNISSGFNKKCLYEETVTVKMERAHSKSRIGVDFGQLGVDVNSLTSVQVGLYPWDWGVDITWGTRTYGPSATDFRFEKVGDDFSYELGMKVAIAAYLDEEPSPAESCTIAAEHFQKIHGPVNTVNVYTGTVTAVGEDYIAYNINTFKGFSGALVFLTDGAEQSASVHEGDLGKVIAVHSGYSYGVTSNVGFMIGKSTPPTPPTSVSSTG
jgi:hypothetical protein